MDRSLDKWSAWGLLARLGGMCIRDLVLDPEIC